MEMDQIIKLIQEVSDSNLSAFKYTEGNLSIELSKGIDNFAECTNILRMHIHYRLKIPRMSVTP